MQAALTAIVFVVAGLLGVVHEATTAHARCAAHGELVDREGPVAAVAAPVSSQDQIETTRPAARGHGDEHCLLASGLRASRIAAGSPAITAAVAIVDHTVILTPAAPRAPAGLYRIAPKTSPPA
ncbi:MAG TPA: hypothetical protein VGD37_35050 [Kofleriaceae bacterium]